MTDSRRVTFDNGRGQLLSALLDLPAGQPVATALFAHCFTCSALTRATAFVAKALTRHGIAVLRVDFTGLGESEGDIADETFTSSVADLVAAAGWLREHHSAPALLVGHSLGGAAVLAAASQIPESTAVATIGAPADTSHARLLFAGADAQIEREGRAQVTLGGRTITLGRELLRDLAEQPQQQRIATLRRALLIMHSPLDEVVGVDNARLIYLAARHPKSFVSLDRASHLLDDEGDARYAAGVIAAWAARYLPMTDEPASVARPVEPEPVAQPLEPGVVTVTESGAGRLGQVIRAGRHTWTSDEPSSVDGAVDSGPTPYDHLLAALGSCTAMTIRLYADHKGWPVGRVGVTLRQDRVHSDDCEATNEGVGPERLVAGAGQGVDVIVREIRIEGDLDSTRRARLLEIAERCPVHRTLESGIRIITRGVD